MLEIPTVLQRSIAMRRILDFAYLLILTSIVPAAEPAGEWIQLFNGRDLTGWTPKIRYHKVGENFGDTFRVEDGVLKVAYDKYPDGFKEQFGHLFYKDSFSNYRLRIEYRFTGEQCPGGPNWAFRNSGVMLHGQSPETMDVDQDFPISIEAQFLGGERDRTTANLCTPYTNVVKDGKLFLPHCTSSKSGKYPGDQWVTVELEVHGHGKIRHIIDGKVVLEYEQAQYDEREDYGRKMIAKNGGLQIQGGTISLQSESHPVEFRKVELMILNE
jgi:hypothetical protein